MAVAVIIYPFLRNFIIGNKVIQLFFSINIVNLIKFY